jgi:hypothetical protein
MATKPTSGHASDGDELAKASLFTLSMILINANAAKEMEMQIYRAASEVHRNANQHSWSIAAMCEQKALCASRRRGQQ